MNKSKDRDNSSIFLEAVKANGLNYKDITHICGKSENTVFKWLNGTLAPDPLALYQLRMALSLSRKLIPYELNRAYNSVNTKPQSWAKSNMSSNDKAVFIGDKIEAKRYIYVGDSLTLTEIAAKSEKPRSSIYNKIRSCKEGDDITSIVKSIKSRRKGK